MQEIKLIYTGSKFENVLITPENYAEEFFDIQIETESDLFYRLRKNNKIEPNKIKDSSPEKIEEIKKYFLKNKKSFYFLFQKNLFIGSILFIKNCINVLIISKKFQGRGFEKELTKFAINKILDYTYKSVEIFVLKGNNKAYKLYKSLGFNEENYGN